MSPKTFVLFAVALCSLQSTLAAEADWEVLNFAISNPGQSNPEILKNSILNILAGFGVSAPPPAPATTTTARTGFYYFFIFLFSVITKSKIIIQLHHL